MLGNTEAAGMISFERAGPVTQLIINNPQRRNAVDLVMWEQARDLLEYLSADKELRVLIVTGKGDKAFAAGADISKFDTERDSINAVRRYGDVSAAVYNRLKHFPRPTIASIGGHCVGAGLALAVCCDIRICGEESRFALPAAKLGLGYGPEGMSGLIELVGPAVTSDIIFTARQLDANEAREVGLVNRVVPTEERQNVVGEYARSISANAPMTIALAKAGRLALRTTVAAEEAVRLQAQVEACYASEDYKEGRAAFIQKRAPNFSGR